jgi:hypothetical protein
MDLPKAVSSAPTSPARLTRQPTWAFGYTRNHSKHKHIEAQEVEQRPCVFPNRLQSLAADGKKRKRLSNALVLSRHRSLPSILAPTLGQLSRKVEERLQSAAFTEVGVVCPAVMSIQALNADALIAPVAAAAVIVADLTMAVNAVAARSGHAASEIAAAWQPSRCTGACRGQHLGGDGRSNRLKSAVGRSNRLRSGVCRSCRFEKQKGYSVSLQLYACLCL